MLLHFAITPAAEIKRRYLYAKFIDGLHNKSSYTEETRIDEKFNPNRFKVASRVKLDILPHRVPLSPGNYLQCSRLLAKSKLLCLALLLVGCALSKCAVAAATHADCLGRRPVCWIPAFSADVTLSMPVRRANLSIPNPLGTAQNRCQAVSTLMGLSLHLQQRGWPYLVSTSNKYIPSNTVRAILFSASINSVFLFVTRFGPGPTGTQSMEAHWKRQNCVTSTS